MPKKWSLTTPSCPEDVACIFAADFVATCKASGDMSNVYRWNSVLSDLRAHAFSVRNFHSKHFGYMGEEVLREALVAEMPHMAQLPLDVTVPTDRN